MPITTATTVWLKADLTALISERDFAEGWADKLAAAISEHTGLEIGEHTSGNNPWDEALTAIQDATCHTAAHAVMQMANEASAALRAVILSALGKEDDGHTPLIGQAVELADQVAELEAELAEARRDQAQLSDHLADQNARGRAVICERDAALARIAELTAEMDALRQAARVASTTPPADAALPVIQLIPAEDCWLWECKVSGRRCHTGNTFFHPGPAADAAARHVSKHHPADTTQEA